MHWFRFELQPHDPKHSLAHMIELQSREVGAIDGKEDGAAVVGLLVGFPEGEFVGSCSVSKAVSTLQKNGFVTVQGESFHLSK